MKSYNYKQVYPPTYPCTNNLFSSKILCYCLVIIKFWSWNPLMILLRIYLLVFIFSLLKYPKLVFGKLMQLSPMRYFFDEMWWNDKIYRVARMNDANVLQSMSFLAGHGSKVNKAMKSYSQVILDIFWHKILWF